jgi:hypothetical protein
MKQMNLEEERLVVATNSINSLGAQVDDTPFS